MERTLRQVHSIIQQHEDDLLRRVVDYLSLPDDIHEEMKNALLNEAASSKKTKKLDPNERCNALLADGTQCTRRHLKAQSKEHGISEASRMFCLIHANKRIGEISSRDIHIPDSDKKKKQTSSTKTVKKMIQNVIRDPKESAVPVIDIEELHVKRIIYNSGSVSGSGRNSWNAPRVAAPSSHPTPTLFFHKLDVLFFLYIYYRLFHRY